MPMKMGGPVQSVAIGDIAYIGGGDAGNDRDSCTVMKLDLQREEWTKLPQYSAKYFAMTSFNNQLVLVGGRRYKDTETNQSDCSACVWGLDSSIPTDEHFSIRVNSCLFQQLHHCSWWI